MKDQIDLNDPAFLKDRRETYRRLRATAPVAVTELNGEEIIVLTRFEDADFLLRDARAVVSPAPGEIPAHLGSGPAASYYRFNVPCVDGSDHQRVRGALSPLFSMKAIAEMKEWVGQIVDRNLDSAASQQRVNVVTQFALAVPIDVTCRLLDMPREDADVLLSLIHEMTAIMSQAEMTAEDLSRSDKASRVYFDYFGSHLDKSEWLPDSSLTKTLLLAERAGRLTRDDSLSALMAVFIGSIHTTMTSITNAVNALGKHRRQREIVVKDPSRLSSAVDEVLRFDPPVHFRHRYVSEPVTMHGHRIEPRVKVMIGLASANWDERVYENPDVFDITRTQARPLTFGGGTHFCLGMRLGRLEAEQFVAKLLSRFPDYTLADAAVVRNDNLTFPHIEQLLVDLNAKH